MGRLSKSLTIIDRLIENGKKAEAERRLRELNKKNPDDITLQSRLGTVLSLSGKFEEAKTYHLRAVNADGKNPNFLFNLAVCENKTGYKDKAITLLEKAVECDPRHYSALNYLGVMLSERRQMDKAETLFKRCLKIDPRKADAHINLSGIYRGRGQIGEAIDHLYHAAKTSSNTSIVYNNIANLFLQSGDHQEARKSYIKALEVDDHNVLAIQNYLLSVHYDNELSNQEIFELHKYWAQKLELRRHSHGHNNLVLTKRRLRVGYVSADLRKHSVGYFMESLISNHDSKAVEVFVYYNYSVIDEITKKFIALVPFGWRDISTLSDREVATLIQEDRIDLLVDLSGHTFHSRLTVFPYRSAPVQLSYLGYPDTTGLSSIDYRITDSLADPPGESDQYHTERLARIPNCFLCYQPLLQHTIPIRENIEATGIIQFGSFNVSSKINADVVALWSRILSKLPTAKLMLKSLGFDDQTTVRNLSDQFQKCGVDSERVSFLGYLPTTEKHFELYNEVDIALDPFPYNGTTTTFEALYMGCPVITLKGERHSARVGYSILANLGLEELVAETEEAYVRIAESLARNPERLKTLKSNLRSRLVASVLMDSGSFAKKIEHAYRQMWLNWCKDKEHGQTAEIFISNGMRLCVPDSENLLTPFVLKEQEDWFETEIEFVRKYLKEGMYCIDIGSNYGIYALNMASKVGDHGLVIAVEPGADAAAYLKMSVQANKFGQVKVYEIGISDTRKSAMLALNENAELNSLQHCSDNTQEPLQHVVVSSLDGLIDNQKIADLHFIKIDAEGEEKNILEGMVQTINDFSPLIMYELTHGEGYNLELVIKFAERGYQSYYLIPGLSILAPFHIDQQIDPYLLNLFACKAEKAIELEQAGMLCNKKQEPAIKELRPDQRTAYWASKTYYPALKALWGMTDEERFEADDRYSQALDAYILSHDMALPPGERYGALDRAFAMLKEISEAQATVPVLLSLVRVATELGERHYAVNVLEIIRELFVSGEPLEIRREHLAVSERFDLIDPGDNPGDWYLASVLEQLVKLKHFSSYFDQQNTMLENLELLRETVFQSPEMERRRQLMLMRAGKLEKPEPAAVLAEQREDNLNSSWWLGIGENKAGITKQ